MVLRVALAGLALFALPSTTLANPVTAGVSLGLAHSAADADVGVDSSRTLGLFGRIGLSSRLSGQLEVSRHSTEDGSNLDIRTGTALLVVDLKSGGRWMPMLMAGAGLDRAEGEFSSTSGHHFEGGFGLEYRSDGGLTLGADVRLGGRSIDDDDVVIQDDVVFIAPSQMREGEYRSARITLGVRF
jgi:opacity protein-like surface antigen